MDDQRINILMVDDRPENLLALEAVLISQNYNLVRAYSGEEALKCVLKNDFALILLDVQMPGLDGFETARLIRSRKKSKNVPIVFITAINQANEFVVQGYKLGAMDYIIKPFHPDTLKIKIELYISIYRDRENLEKLVQARTSDLSAANKRLQQEVMERIEVSERLAKSNERIASILESTTDAFFALDGQWRFIYVNSAAERLWGITREKLIGKIMWDEFPEAIGTSLESEYYKAVFRQKAVHFEAFLPVMHRWVEVHAYPYQDGLSVYFHDISERKRAEREIARLDRLDLVGEMAAGIAHEIRNPMTTVRGFLQLLGTKKECVKYQEYYSLMIDELDRANSIISEFLSLARNNTNDFKLQSLNCIINVLMPLITADAIKSDKNIIAQYGDIQDLLLNEQEIRQIVLNLTRNGLEAMPSGKILTIKTYMEGDEVVLSVQDQGKEIAPDILNKMGTPFFTTKNNGTGLGLATCYSIANRHNAAISVETGPAGTTFFIRFKIPNELRPDL
ncbi:signal transduction histidine kinase, nitrogen specific, NtrB [Desulfofarcimen acetoxidans DSM 771]|uniref:Stage 0 sporulation protein A homolog n=1 Tax=Desulfofarcimen acetoxidans (strain ATCC 49208 / DSM 771 / KCTC 5769 / VKM B-1644 / 5575) TaxID=485916 RepID=C8W3H4_DESAS|nr:response regulator [Desulfofarcimen acetoxidans]ACV63760.1 signal transduction histidine kinase, nitrogen specific, NtrB [Desulfofarcimen acetoxidans DSM 771]